MSLVDGLLRLSRRNPCVFFDGVENSALQLTKQASVQRITACAATEAQSYLILSITTTPPNAPGSCCAFEWIDSVGQLLLHLSSLCSIRVNNNRSPRSGQNLGQ